MVGYRSGKSHQGVEREKKIALIESENSKWRDLSDDWIEYASVARNVEK